LEVVSSECEVKSDKICELEALQQTTASERDSLASSLSAAKTEIQTLKSERDFGHTKIGCLEDSISVHKTVLSNTNRDLEKYRKDAGTIFEMKVQCTRAEAQRDSNAREAEKLRLTIDAMTKNHDQILARVREDFAKDLFTAQKRISELENKMMAAFNARINAVTIAPSPAE
jgi:uncharacterized coiled-coil DUF342 family protein